LQEGIESTAAESLEGAIKDAQRLVLTGTGYNSEAEAISEGELWRGRLMRAFATLNIAADFGDETRLGGGFTVHGLAAIGRGRRVLNDPLKLWAYEETDENPLFVVTNPISEFWVSSPHERLEAALTYAIARGDLSRELQVSYSLYAASFGLAPEPRFAMLMIAFESLIRVKPRSAEVQTHVRSMMTATQGSELPANEIQSICGSLNWLLDQSINQAGRELAKSLGPREYLNGEAPGKFFTRCYTVRSRLVHGNHPIPSPTELGQLAAPLEHMVSEIIAQADHVDDGSP
jgi:HAMP domain-containing protein